MNRPCEGIVLRSTPFSETSSILVIFTRDLGRVEALAKGCRRPKGPFAGQIDLYHRCECMILERSRAGLDLLTEAALLEEYVGLRRRVPAFASAALLGELVLATCMVRDPHPRLYDVLAEGFRFLAGGAETGPVCGAVLFGVLRDLGFAPRLDCCVHCETPLAEGLSASLAGTEGGLLCAECAEGRDAPVFDPRGVAALRYLERTPLPAAERLQQKSTGMRRLLAGLIRYAEDSIGQGLRSRDFLLRSLDRRPVATSPVSGTSRGTVSE